MSLKQYQDQSTSTDADAAWDDLVNNYDKTATDRNAGYNDNVPESQEVQDHERGLAQRGSDTDSSDGSSLADRESGANRSDSNDPGTRALRAKSKDRTRGFFKKKKKRVLFGAGSLMVAGGIITTSIFSPLVGLVSAVKKLDSEYFDKRGAGLVYRYRQRNWKSVYVADQTDGFVGPQKGQWVTMNRASKKYVDGMRQSGWILEQDRGLARFRNATSGETVEITNTIDARRRLAAIDREVFPGTRNLWIRGRGSTSMFNVLGLSRFGSARVKLRQNFAQQVDNAIDQYKARRRQSASAAGVVNGSIDRVPTVDGDDNPIDGSQATNEFADAVDEYADEASEIATRLDDLDYNPTTELRRQLSGQAGKIAAQISTRVAAGTLLRGISITGQLDALCSIYHATQAITSTTRVIRGSQLASLGVDLVANGQLVETLNLDGESAQAAMGLAQVMGTDDPETGRNFWASPAWQLASNPSYSGVIDQGLLFAYSVGGGLGGEVQKVIDVINTATFGQVNSGCAIVTNPVVRIGGFTAGLVLTGLQLITAWSGVTAGTLVADFGSQAALEVLKAAIGVVAVTVIPHMIAGSVGAGSEVGDGFATASIAGIGWAAARNGMRIGGKPLTRAQVAEVEVKYREEQVITRSQQSLFSRVFSPNDPDSLLSAAHSIGLGNNLHNSVTQPGVLARAAKSALANAFSSVQTFALQSFRSPRALADDLSPNSIYTDQLGNYHIGETVGNQERELNDPEWSPINIRNRMISLGHIEDDDSPKSDTYDEYLSRCILFNDDFDPFYHEGSEDTLCTEDSEEKHMFRAYYSYWHQINVDMSDGLFNDYSAVESGAGGGGNFADPGERGRDTTAMSCGDLRDGGIGELPPGNENQIRLCVLTSGTTVNASIAQSAERLINDAVAAGHNISGWGYRSHQRQVELRIENCGGSSHYHIYQKPSGQCSPPTARPGGSNHEYGVAIDFHIGGAAVRLDRGAAHIAAFRWLEANAGDYGFINLPSENWHWSIDGN